MVVAACPPSAAVAMGPYPGRPWLAADRARPVENQLLHWIPPRICSRTLMGCSLGTVVGGAPHPCSLSRDSSLLPSISADARSPDDVTAIEGHYSVRAYTWYHSCVRAAAEERFVKPEIAHIFHMKLANYFSGRWASRNPTLSNREPARRTLVDCLGGGGAAQSISVSLSGRQPMRPFIYADVRALRIDDVIAFCRPKSRSLSTTRRRRSGFKSMYWRVFTERICSRTLMGCSDTPHRGREEGVG